MKKLLIGAVLFLTVSCSPSGHEAVTQEVVDLVNRQVDLLATIQDEASARSALAKMNALVERSRELKKRLEALGAPPEDIGRSSEERMRAVVKRYMREVSRVRQIPETREWLDKILENALLNQ